MIGKIQKIEMYNLKKGGEDGNKNTTNKRDRYQRVP